MVTLVSSSGKTRYNIKEYYLDTPDDLKELESIKFDEAGSKAKVISTGETYIRNSQGQWIYQTATSGAGGGGGTPSYGIGPGLEVVNGTLRVKTTDNFEGDKTLPITAAGVEAVVGNVEALLGTI